MICIVLLNWFDDANISTFANIVNILQIFYEINF